MSGRHFLFISPDIVDKSGYHVQISRSIIAIKTLEILRMTFLAIQFLFFKISYGRNFIHVLKSLGIGSIWIAISLLLKQNNQVDGRISEFLFSFIGKNIFAGEAF